MGWGGICQCPDGKKFPVGVEFGQKCDANKMGCYGGRIENCKEQIGDWSGKLVDCGYEHGSYGGTCLCPSG